MIWIFSQDHKSYVEFRPCNAFKISKAFES